MPPLGDLGGYTGEILPKQDRLIIVIFDHSHHYGQHDGQPGLF